MDDTSFEKIAKALNSASLPDPKSIDVTNQSFFGPKPIFREIEAPVSEGIFDQLKKTINVKVKLIGKYDECDFQLSPYESISTLKYMIYEKLDITPINQKLTIGSKVLNEYKLLIEYTNKDSIQIFLSEKHADGGKGSEAEKPAADVSTSAQPSEAIPPVNEALLLEEVRAAIIFTVRDQNLSQKLFDSFREISHRIISENNSA